MHTPSTYIVPVGMTKHRLEFFADGIFAIILTILVLDLKVPEADGLMGLKQATPSLLVHTLTFFVVSVMWIAHNVALSLLDEINDKIIRLNLIGMFWVTLIPFGAKIASEHPQGSLGAFMIAISYCFAGLALRPMFVFMRKGSEMSFAPEVRAYILRRRRAVNINILLIAPACSALTLVSPWFGYFGLAYVSLFIMFTPTTVSRIQQIMKASEPDVEAGI